MFSSSKKTTQLRPLHASLLLCVLVLLLDFSVNRWFYPTAEFDVDCQALVSDQWQLANKVSLSSPEISRFSPHDNKNTFADNDPLKSTPQVFRVIAAFNDASSNSIVTQQCQAVYTNVSAHYGSNQLEIPAHCFFGDLMRTSAVDKRSGVNASTQASHGLRTQLKNYCVYMGEDVQSPDDIFAVEEIACKYNPARPANQKISPKQQLVNDSCLVKLDKPVPKSIRQQALNWWRPDPNINQSAAEQLSSLLGIYQDEYSCNINSGNIESRQALHLVSHSIDNDGLGLRRVVSTGKAIYQHSIEGVILAPGRIPNNIDTRSGDSGGAVFIYDEGVKKLLGIQVAVLSAYSDYFLTGTDADANDRDSIKGDGANKSLRKNGYLKNYNIAINPHIAEGAIAGYPYIIQRAK